MGKTKLEAGRAGSLPSLAASNYRVRARETCFGGGGGAAFAGAAAAAAPAFSGDGWVRRAILWPVFSNGALLAAGGAGGTPALAIEGSAVGAFMGRATEATADFGTAAFVAVGISFPKPLASSSGDVEGVAAYKGPTIYVKHMRRTSVSTHAC